MQVMSWRYACTFNGHLSVPCTTASHEGKLHRVTCCGDLGTCPGIEDDIVAGLSVARAKMVASKQRPQSNHEGQSLTLTPKPYNALESLICY